MRWLNDVGQLWRQLAVSQSGNVLAIGVAALIPLMGVIGGGVDISRAYMAKTQLQSACDSGVLAGRKAMGVSGIYGTSEKAKASSMFNFNFDGATVKATGVSFVTADNDLGQVNGTATATIGTVIMQMFGKKNIALSVNCMAELQIANADVMFVLDTTGSMAGTKIAGLKDAVRDFHKTINGSVKDKDTRIRYGFVPYSVTVNAGDLVANGDLPASYFVSTAKYQSREAYFNTPTYVGTTANLGTVNETYASAIQQTDCNNYGTNDYPSSGNNPVVTGTAPSKVTTKTYAYVSWTKTGTSGSGKNKVNIGTCVRKLTTTETTYVLKYAFTSWRYKQLPLDVSQLKAFATVNLGTNVSSALADVAGYYDPLALAKNNGTTLQGVGVTASSWNGCIEERDTVSSATWDPIPSGAYDLDLDLVPTSDQTRWKPYWGNVVFSRSSAVDTEVTTTTRSPLTEYCPAPMELFKTVELSSDPNDVPAWLDTYLNGLIARGSTYHDSGMIWGGRLSSSTGIFQDNVNEGDKLSVSRHIIFMTDGIMEPNINGYNAYGTEYVDNRVAPRNTSLANVTARHTARFLAACEEAKAKGITVWVIAFGTTLSNDLKTCASSGRAYELSDTTALRNTFKYIASQVADLRLGQ